MQYVQQQTVSSQPEQTPRKNHILQVNAAAGISFGAKIAIIIGAVAVTAGIAIGAVLLLGDSPGSNIPRNIPDAVKITSISYARDLEYEGIPFLSISPDGEYAVIANRESYYLQILRNNRGRYEHHKNINMPGDTPEEHANRVIARLTDSDIVWSNSGEKFAFSLGMDALSHLLQSCIYICDIRAENIIQLTGQEIDWEAGRFGDSSFIADYSPAWSDDDRTVYFVRFGHSGGLASYDLYSVSSGGSSIDRVRSFDSSSYIYNLFCRGSTLYYTVLPIDPNSTTGIFMYHNGRETILAENNVYLESIGRNARIDPVLVDISPDGKNMLYTFAPFFLYGNTDNGADTPVNVVPAGVLVYEFGNTFILASTSSPHETRPLSVGPVNRDIDMNDSDAVNMATIRGEIIVTLNAIFSPDGRSVLVRANDYNIYVADVSDPVKLQKIVFDWTTDSGEPDIMLFRHQVPINREILQTKWLTNGFIAMNSGSGVILWEIITDGSKPNWNIG